MIENKNKYNPAIHHRKSLRLKGVDYGKPGFYFVTICCHNRIKMFGHIENKKMVLNDSGAAANVCWRDIPEHYSQVILHEWIVMPDHIHGIIELTPINTGVHNDAPLVLNQFKSPSNTIGAIVRGFKIGVTKWMRKNTNIHTVWQRNYDCRILCRKNEIGIITKYIRENPSNWKNV